MSIKKKKTGHIEGLLMNLWAQVFVFDLWPQSNYICIFRQVSYGSLWLGCERRV